MSVSDIVASVLQQQQQMNIDLLDSVLQKSDSILKNQQSIKKNQQSIMNLCKQILNEPVKTQISSCNSKSPKMCWNLNMKKKQINVDVCSENHSDQPGQGGGL